MAQAEEAPVLVDRADGIVTITINRPRVKNAINGAAWDILGGTFTSLAGDESVRAVVITGAGGAFSAGADLSGQRADGHPLDSMRGVNRIAKALYDLPKPTVAKVPGVAVGAGSPARSPAGSWTRSRPRTGCARRRSTRVDSPRVAAWVTTGEWVPSTPDEGGRRCCAGGWSGCSRSWRRPDSRDGGAGGAGAARTVVVTARRCGTGRATGRPRG